MNPKQITTFLRDLICVPRCAACDERLSPIPEREDGPTHGKICLCKACGEKWEKAKVQMCPNCYNISEKCTCTPDFFFKYQPEIPSLCFYGAEAEAVASKMIISMKRQATPHLFDFVAIELTPKVAKTLGKMGIDGGDCVFTWIPRQKKSIAESGFDQGKLLSKRLAKSFGAECSPLFLRIGGKEQKKLDKKSRKKNAEQHIKLNDAMKGFPQKVRKQDLNAYLHGKTVIIVDDVLTSGATLRRGVELINKTKASRAIAVCVAKSIKNGGKPKN